MEPTHTNMEIDELFFFFITHTKTYFVQMGKITWVTEAKAVSPDLYVKALA